MANGEAAVEAARFGATDRRDLWWVGPLATFLGLGGFVVYSTWSGLQAAHYAWGSYLSPFYSPLLFDAPGQPPGHSWFGAWPGWWPGWLPASPAILILIFPASFRATCYYYRKAYYRSFFVSPVACAVTSLPRKGYGGETRFPFILQNLHRYTMFAALAFIVILWSDVVLAFTRHGPKDYVVGLGTLVLLANTTLLSLYTFSCHSLRHLIGGHLDCFSTCALVKAQHKAWQAVSRLNEHHMLWAWLSLFMVGFSDLYVRLVSMGIWNDLKIL